MITLDDFPDNFRDIAETIGVDAAVALCEFAGGTQLYIPKLDNVTRLTRNKELCNEYINGKSFAQLAVAYNLTEYTVRGIIAEIRNKNKTTIEDFI
jgi:Mor family transcriptional regulator